MRKILIALALIASVQIASAQSKSPAEAKKAVEAAELAAQNPKKAVKPATWLKVADAYVKAYDAPTGSVVAGATKQELMFMMGNEKPTSTEEVVIGGQPYTKEVYANKDLYFNANGQLAIIDVTQPVYEDALAKAIEAYKKAAEVDPALSKGKDIRAGLELISGKYINDAYNCYQFGDYAGASVLFEKAADAMETAPLNKMDTTAIYNAGFTAWISKDYSRAQKFFEKCLANNYYYEGGEVFAKLADVYTNLGQKDAARDVLEKGFTTYPQSQSILIGLINYYLESGQNTDRLFVLINEAKKNEPDNASLYYVEGNIYKELGKTEDAVKAYYKCADINPDYEFGYIGVGILYYNQAIELQEKAANEFDDKKYEALVADFNTALKNAIKPFEKAFEVSKDNSIKVNVAEYLKNIYYRFSSESQEYMDGYKKYNEIVKSGQAM
jgi:tetratricopeptide (TPR) repeat protein